MLVKGIKIESLSIDEAGNIRGNYCLMSNIDKVLAKQAFSKEGYGDIHITYSPETVSIINKLTESVKNDLLKILGLEE